MSKNSSTNSSSSKRPAARSNQWRQDHDQPCALPRLLPLIRALSDMDDADNGAASDSHDDAASSEANDEIAGEEGEKEAVAAPSRPTKRRKSTHVVRKEEIAALMSEKKALEHKLAFLRGEVFVPTQTADGETIPRDISNRMLRDVTFQQQLQFASARSMLSQAYANDLAAPSHAYIHLPRAMTERRTVLAKLKPRVLRNAHRFMVERAKFLDVTQPHATSEHFVTAKGDSCAVHFYVDQFPNHHTVKEVYDATTFYASHLEMAMTESSGNFVVREESAEGHTSMAQHRLHKLLGDGVAVDTNTLVFSTFDTTANYGLLTATYVDQDDLHPYLPQERLRCDASAIVLVTQEETCIALRRWTFSRSHCPPQPLSTQATRLVRDHVAGGWIDAMLPFIQEHLSAVGRGVGVFMSGLMHDYRQLLQTASF